MHKVRLKGGSLSGTWLCTDEHGRQFVRKDVSLSVNREYGFYRWYSQLKRMQRYSVLFPGLFPDLLDFGQEGDHGYFDMAYVPDTVTAHEFACSTADPAAIERMFDALLAAMARIHATRIPSTASPMALYMSEEVEQKMKACLDDADFAAFMREPTIVWNGVEVPGLAGQLDAYKAMALRHYRHTTETFTHGNITLENLLYQPATNRIVFIDPYEENVIDSELAEYSQVLQSSNSKYELYNAGQPTIDGHRVSCSLPPAPGLDHFNDLFLTWMRGQLDDDAWMTVRLLEVSQFCRMLPFKIAIDRDKAFFFYGLASHLFASLRQL